MRVPTLVGGHALHKSTLGRRCNTRERERPSPSASLLRHQAAHRGAAFADFNHDGKADVVTTSLNESAELWWNELSNEHHWLTIQLIGTKSNWDGSGAKIKLTTAAGVQFTHTTTSIGDGSSSSRLVHFGWGKEADLQQIEIRWPSGIKPIFSHINADRLFTIREAEAK